MDSERRQYFRINQQIAMEITPLPADSAVLPPSTRFEVPASFEAVCELQQQDAESETLLQRIADRDPDIANYLGLMSERINTLARTVVTQEIDFNRLVTRDVNLSEGGMLFYTTDALPAQRLAAVKLIFPAAQLGLNLSGRILRCDPVTNDLFEVAVEFLRLPESTRTLLARQIMESQALSRRSEIA